jgi:capsular polysaccharide transport system permease protein
MTEPRSSLSITFAVWRALFLREALDRLFDMRAAWLWLLMEPVMHIAFITVVFSAIRVLVIGGIETPIWIIVGMLAFFLFRRTAVQVMYAVESNQPMFAYRQVKPFDVAIVRAGLEAFLMVLISTVILVVAGFMGYEAFPPEPLQVALALLGMWLFGLGYGLVASVLIELVPETKHILTILMMPLYLLSGVIWSMKSVPQPYRDVLLINPLVHGLELVRQGFGSYYQTVPGVSMGYLYIWAGCSIFLGLALYRRFAVELVTT